jgi:hypothetical protein
MVEIFNRTLASVNASDWNHTQWMPEAVVINLGVVLGFDLMQFARGCY